MNREVAIIGCGPAGLLAAHAAVLADYSPVIFSAEVKPSPNAKAVFLHRAIPDLTSPEPDDVIQFQKWGDGHGYAAKVYGDPEAPTSWELFQEGAVPAWHLAPAYASLWHLYRGAVKKLVAGPAQAADLLATYPVVINTAPLYHLCHAGCSFPSRRIWVKDEAPRTVVRNEMIYNGDEGDEWYRASDLFGVRSTEFCEHQPGAAEGLKVLPTDCVCWSSIVRAGRWGMWMPGVLIHNAFETAVAALSVDDALRAA